MAKDSSFDIVSEVDMQAIDDAINVAVKEIKTRYDLKDQNITIEFLRGEKKVIVNAPSEFHRKMVEEILHQKILKRGLDIKSLRSVSIEKASGDSVRETLEAASGIEKEMAKTIAKDIKDMKLKVQTSIQENQIRVSAQKKDDLQEVIAMIKEKDYPLPLQFTNYR